MAQNQVKSSRNRPGVGACTPEGPARRMLETHARQEAEINLAGPQAERRFWRQVGRRVSPLKIDSDTVEMLRDDLTWWEPSDGPRCDEMDAVRVLDEVVSTEDVPATLRDVRGRVTRLLRHPRTWAAVEAVAEELLTHRSLDGDTVDAIIGKVSPPRWRFEVPAC